LTNINIASIKIANINIANINIANINIGNVDITDIDIQHCKEQKFVVVEVFQYSYEEDRGSRAVEPRIARGYTAVVWAK
jgi:hypothetical protein